MDGLKFKKSIVESISEIQEYVPTNTVLNETIDLREWDSPIEDQKSVGSCTSHAVTSAYELLLKREYLMPNIELSRLFVYYNSRYLQGTEEEDTGTSIFNSIMSIIKFGVCQESAWPYVPSSWGLEPTVSAYVNSKLKTIRSFYYMLSINDILNALNDKNPVVVGIAVSNDIGLVNEANPVIQVPKPGETTYGHALVLVGYNRETKQFLVKNSFGTAWGIHGYGYLPFEYLDTELYEAWTFDIQVNRPA